MNTLYNSLSSRIHKLYIASGLSLRHIACAKCDKVRCSLWTDACDSKTHLSFVQIGHRTSNSVTATECRLFGVHLQQYLLQDVISEVTLFSLFIYVVSWCGRCLVILPKASLKWMVDAKLGTSQTYALFALTESRMRIVHIAPRCNHMRHIVCNQIK